MTAWSKPLKRKTTVRERPSPILRASLRHRAIKLTNLHKDIAVVVSHCKPGTVWDWRQGFWIVPDEGAVSFPLAAGRVLWAWTPVSDVAVSVEIYYRREDHR